MSIFNAQAIPQVKAEIYFGLPIPDGACVSGAEFDEFLAESVTPHFPGFTIDYTTGYWKGVPESSWRPSILAEDSGAVLAT